MSLSPSRINALEQLVNRKKQNLDNQILTARLKELNIILGLQNHVEEKILLQNVKLKMEIYFPLKNRIAKNQNYFLPHTMTSKGETLSFLIVVIFIAEKGLRKYI